MSSQFASLTVRSSLRCLLSTRAHGGRNELREIHRPPAGGVAVTGLGSAATKAVNVIVAHGDVDQGLRVSFPELVQERVDQAEGRLPVRGGSLIGEGDPARHKRRGGARPTATCPAITIAAGRAVVGDGDGGVGFKGHVRHEPAVPGRRQVLLVPRAPETTLWPPPPARPTPSGRSSQTCWPWISSAALRPISSPPALVA